MGRGVKFPLQIDSKTGKLAMVSHEEDIAEAIGIIIGTYKGERVMRPEFGSTAADYVFASTAHSFVDSVAYDIRRQLILQEPRIEKVKVTCENLNGTSGGLVLDISYVVRSTNNRYNRVYPFFTEHTEQQSLIE